MLIKSHLKNSAIYKAKEMIATGTERSVIFGGKTNFIKRCLNKISKEEFLKKRFLPIYSVGEANYKGNRLFEIKDKTEILFKPDKNSHIILNLKDIGKNRIKMLNVLKEIQFTKTVPITYSLDTEYIHISVDNSVFEKHVYRTIKDRVIAIDINPEFIGWSITDWSDTGYKLVTSGLISIQPLNNKHNALSLSSDDKKNLYFNNKRKHEIIHVAKQLFMLCKHYRCETFAMEDLDMKHKTVGSKRVNRLINNLWCRNLLTHQIKKHILCSPTTFVSVQPQYSSIIGNIVYRGERLPDPILASIEIGRRGFEYSTQYIYKRRQIKKTVILPDFNSVRTRIALSLEEMGICGHVKDWLELFSAVKKPGVKYRFPLAECLSASHFSKFYKQKMLIMYSF
jgi:ISCaje4 transposase tnpB